MLTVAREMDLANNPAFMNAKGSVPHGSLDDAVVRQSTVLGLQRNMHIVLVPKTDIIRISYNSLNSKLAADIVNKVMSTYIQRSYETRFASTQRVSQWLSSQLDDLKQQVQVSQERMMDLPRRLGTRRLDPAHSQISPPLDDLPTTARHTPTYRIHPQTHSLIIGRDCGRIGHGTKVCGIGCCHRSCRVGWSLWRSTS